MSAVLDNGRLLRAETMAQIRAVFSCPHFFAGYREAFDGAPIDYDRDFGLAGDDLKLAQLRYENGRECALMAISDGYGLAWRTQFPIPQALLIWALTGD